ncbi:MAG TPA: tRNA 2-thiouridine(34) synthase MnmA [Gammaproteobacteria bacterium]|nr:tRNA 2-thiouridine(34) synthase MnmA [Gammaproteobacteria bacterium]
MSTPNSNVIVGLSGGVDSSVSALLLLNQGYNVQGLFMKNWVDLQGDENCPIEDDLADARQVSEKLNIPFHWENFAPEYWDNVFTHFLDEYRAGRTPNPDILCNREVKFKVFLDHALAMGAEKIATGHYAQIEESDGLYILKRAMDKNKDQTYFLYTLKQSQLSKTLFPLGMLKKPQVRQLANDAGFVTHDKKDSTGICFIGERNFRDFLSQFIPAQPGLVQTADGKNISEHQGIMYYTLGQRKGLGIGGRRSSSEEPWFVVGKKIKENILVVAQGHDHPLMFSNALTAIDLSWTSGITPDLPFQCTAKTRYRQSDQACSILKLDQNKFKITFESKQRAMTPGQSIVFYQGDICLGGGIIDEVDNIIYG